MFLTFPLKLIDRAWENPIKLLPFVMFDIVDRTGPASTTNQTYSVGWKHVEYYVDADDLPTMIENTTDKSFFLQARGKSVKPDTDVYIRVSCLTIYLFNYTSWSFKQRFSKVAKYLYWARKMWLMVKVCSMYIYILFLFKP